MLIRKTTENDIEEILRIYDTARRFMAENGNPTQWKEGYPGIEALKKDIADGNSYVFTDGKGIVASFSFIIGDEPTYQIIEGGAWHSDKPYGTIHRLASNGEVKGIARECFDYCTSQIDYVRIDTHGNNIPMQSIIKKYGFERCGIIHVSDGSERIAFDLIIN